MIHLLLDRQVRCWFKELVFLRFSPNLFFKLGRCRAHFPRVFQGDTYLFIPARPDLLARISLRRGQKEQWGRKEQWKEFLNQSRISARSCFKLSSKVHISPDLLRNIRIAALRHFRAARALLYSWREKLEAGGHFFLLYECVEFAPHGVLLDFLKSQHLTSPAYPCLREARAVLTAYISAFASKKGILNVDWTLRNFLVGKNNQVFLTGVLPKQSSSFLSWEELRSDARHALVRDTQLVSAGLLLIAVLNTLPTLLSGVGVRGHNPRHCFVNTLLLSTVRVVCGKKGGAARSAYLQRVLAATEKLESCFQLTRDAHSVVSHACRYAKKHPLQQANILQFLFSRFFCCPLCPQIPEWLVTLQQEVKE